jgi:dipeptidyl aminopeptidase/acylaminoacyl peptidase
MRHALLRILCIGIAAGCTEDLVVPPPPPQPPPAPPPSPAVIVLTVITTGGRPDENGYLLRIDGVNYGVVAVSGERELTVSAGTHSLQLEDIAGNCILAGQNPRSLLAPAGGRLAVTFDVSCPIPSSLDVSTSTIGVSLDPDGYALSASGSDWGTIGVTDSKHFDLLTPGFYSLRVSSVSGNCSVEGGSSKSVMLPEGQTVTVRFDVTCVARTEETAGEKLVVSSRDPGSDANLVIMEVDGSKRQPLIDDPGEELSPEFSPDGTRVLFLWQGWKLTVLDLASRGETVLPSQGVERAVWSPDGARVAFSRNGRIFRMNSDGSGEFALTNGGNDRDPYWSPDGSRIAFSRGSAVYVVNADGTDVRRISNDQRLAGPWAPDGHRIIVTQLECFDYYYYGCYYGPSPADLLILDLDTGTEQALTQSPLQVEWSPTWSRDGQRIYYISTANGNPDVFVIPAGGGTPVNLTNTNTREEWVSLGMIGAVASAQRAARIRRP